MAWERIIQAISTNINPQASDFKVWAELEQGWHRKETSNGPLKYIDKNGVARLTLKQGTQRVPGSNDPHVEFKNANNIRI
jgi:filamentous hemagglutinin